jgi:ribulose-5-phosphate 4-epimerase/fuculose-1-phosphate aldolase
MIQTGNKLHDTGIAPGTDSSITIRTKMGFLSSPAWVTLDAINKETIVEVRGVVFGLNRPSIYAKGAVNPNAETLMHSDIYESRPEINAIIIASEPEIVRNADKLNIPSTGKEQPAGSQELAQEAASFVESNKGVNCFLLKNQGIVILGTTLTEAVKTVEELLAKTTAEKPAKTAKNK